jgi:integrase
MLTDTQCRNAKPQAKPYKLADDKGLHLEVKPNGGKAWRYRFELVKDGARKESIFAIGVYVQATTGETLEAAQSRRAGGRFTLAEARDERTKARDLVKRGINPAHQRQQDRVQTLQDFATTFEAVAAEWLALRDWEEVTKARRLNMLSRVVFPKIGKMPIKAVTPAHVLDVLTTAAKDNGPTVAAEAQRTMSAVFDLAVATLRADNDPVYPVRKALPKNKTQHKRALTIAEVGQLLRDLEGYDRNFQTVAAFKLQWLTLARPNEALGAQWSEFDLDNALWRIPSERMKMRREHLIPLPIQAVALLRKVQAVNGHRIHVFPHRDDREKQMTDATLRQALKGLGWAGKFSPHATRHTGSTRLNELGFNPDWIERQLAHAERDQVRRTYNQAEHFTDRATMMQQWADMLDAWQKGAAVIPLRVAAR